MLKLKKKTIPERKLQKKNLNEVDFKNDETIQKLNRVNFILKYGKNTRLIVDQILRNAKNIIKLNTTQTISKCLKNFNIKNKQ